MFKTNKIRFLSYLQLSMAFLLIPYLLILAIVPLIGAQFVLLHACIVCIVYLLFYTKAKLSLSEDGLQLARAHSSAMVALSEIQKISLVEAKNYGKLLLVYTRNESFTPIMLKGMFCINLQTKLSAFAEDHHFAFDTPSVEEARTELEQKSANIGSFIIKNLIIDQQGLTYEGSHFPWASIKNIFTNGRGSAAHLSFNAGGKVVELKMSYRKHFPEILEQATRFSGRLFEYEKGF